MSCVPTGVKITRAFVIRASVVRMRFGAIDNEPVLLEFRAIEPRR